MSTSLRRTRQLLIAAKCFADAEATLPLILPLLKLMPARLAGILAEERITELAVTADQQIVSTRGRRLEIPSQLETLGLSKSDARAFERTLAETAAAQSTEWRFKTEPGDLISSVCASVSDEDLVLLGHRPLLRQRGRVLLLRSRSATKDRAQEMASKLAQALRTVVSEVPPEEGEVSQDILARVDRSHASLVVADFRAGPLKTREELRRLLDAARCPVAVLGVAEIRRRNRSPAQKTAKKG
ncbi:MAG: hypothetical protein HKP40_10880 [Litoreibacter sp.]|nr:hypothetical protein [Litoreibacter sp.]